MNERERYALAIAEQTFNGSFEEFIASNVNGGGDNAGSGNAGGGNDGNRKVDTESIFDVIKSKLNTLISRPMAKQPMSPSISDSDLESIIKPLDTVVDTGEIIDDNKFIKSEDATPTSDVVESVISKPKQSIKNETRRFSKGKITINNAIISPVEVFDKNKNRLSESDEARLLLEEETRRKMGDGRIIDFNDAEGEEQERRLLFDEELQLMISDFQVFLKTEFPEFVGNKNIDDGDVNRIKTETNQKKKQNKTKLTQLQKKKLRRLQKEKKRKETEANLKLNKLSEKEVQTFFEEEIVIEQQQKLTINRELIKLNPVERQMKEFEDMELRMGRPIVPHRDIVESEDSDFDINTYTEQGDILIKPFDSKKEMEDQMKNDKLEILRRGLNKDNTEEDYISYRK